MTNKTNITNEIIEENSYHTSVLLKESVDALEIIPNGIYVDLTFGGGGHSKEILKRLSPDGILVSFDQDADAMQNIPNDDRIIFVQNNFKHLRSVLRAHGIEKVDGILADLGVSSHHFDASQRGFSFRFDSELDMRMNCKSKFSALDVINNYEHGDLLKVIRDYGELKNPHKIAGDIIVARPINTTKELVNALAAGKSGHDDTKFLAKLFQAIRIEVNGELEALKMMLEQCSKVLNTDGRLSIITYHSLEDRTIERIGVIFTKLDNGLWNTMTMNYKPIQGFFTLYYPIIILLIVILILLQSIDTRTKELYEENNILIENYRKTHNIEMIIGKEYIIKTSEEYIINETKERVLKLQENIKPPMRIYIHE